MYPFFYNPNYFNTYDSNENFVCPYFLSSYNNSENTCENFRGDYDNFENLEKT